MSIFDDMRDILDTIGQIPTSVVCHPDDIEQVICDIQVVSYEETRANRDAPRAGVAVACSVFDGLKVLPDQTGTIPRGSMLVLDQHGKPITEHNEPGHNSEEAGDG